MQFELFERKSRATSTVPTIGVQTRGTMSMNAAAFDLLTGSATARSAPRKPKQPSVTPPRSGKQTAKSDDGADATIEFLYDKANKVVGIRLAAPESLNSYPVRKQPQAESYLVTAKAFLAFHGIATDTLRRYVARMYDGGVLGFSMAEDEIK